MQIVPYNTAMQLGSGFNSFTQTLCLDHAVVPDPDVAAAAKLQKEEGKDGRLVAQQVSYKTSVITKATDVTDTMSVNAAFQIKYDQLKVEGSGQFVNTNKIKDSDITIMVSVKVVNQTIYDHSLVKFQPIPNIKNASAQRLAEIYGDCFISGWQEGGEFLGVISIKAKDRNEANSLITNATIAYSQNANLPAGSDKKHLQVDLKGEFDKMRESIAAENEVSISVTWTGGGQNLKAREKDWNFDTMKEVALKFPDLVADTPMRTHALLTKYTALRSFHTTQSFDLPVYDKTGTYTNVLQEAYLDYKSILGAIQVLAFDVAEGTKGLLVNPRSQKAVELANAATDKPSKTDTLSLQAAKESTPGTATDGESTTEGSVVDVPTDSKPPAPKIVTFPPPEVKEPFPATVEGLEEARLKCRFMMSRIVQEIDNITIKPSIATDETHQPPYLSPFLFKMLVPIGVPLPTQPTAAAQAAAASKFDPDALAAKLLPS